MDKSVSNLDTRLEYLEAQNEDAKEEIKKLVQVLITLGKYEERFLRLEKTLDDLRHGDGWVLPLEWRHGRKD